MINGRNTSPSTSEAVKLRSQVQSLLLDLDGILHATTSGCQRYTHLQLCTSGIHGPFFGHPYLYPCQGDWLKETMQLTWNAAYRSRQQRAWWSILTHWKIQGIEFHLEIPVQNPRVCAFWLIKQGLNLVNILKREHTTKAFSSEFFITQNIECTWMDFYSKQLFFSPVFLHALLPFVKPMCHPLLLAFPAHMASRFMLFSV